MHGTLRSNLDYVLLAVSPDGQTALACVNTANVPSAPLWMFGQGTWNLLEAGADEDASPRFGNPYMNGIAGLVFPDGQTAYCACHSGLLRCLRLGGVDEEPRRSRDSSMI